MRCEPCRGIEIDPIGNAARWQPAVHAADRCFGSGDSPGAFCHDCGVDPIQPYGPLVDTSARFVTWNVWGRFGPWQRREDGIRSALAACGPDVVALQEAWSGEGRDQAADLGDALGLPYHRFHGSREFDGVPSGVAVLSRWPIEVRGATELAGPPGHTGVTFEVAIEGPRGVIRLFDTMPDHPPQHSSVRQAQVSQLVDIVRARRHRGLTVVCGDFNTGPDTDEIRMITAPHGTSAGTTRGT
jgi:endonuclease/exonuclease/phosphatase family metal-dependent hydrolase